MSASGQQKKYVHIIVCLIQNYVGNTSFHSSLHLSDIFHRRKKNEKDLIYFISIYRGKNILELGAGATGLAGLIIAATCQPNSVQITDGNSESVDYILF